MTTAELRQVPKLMKYIHLNNTLTMQNSKENNLSPKSPKKKGLDDGIKKRTLSKDRIDDENVSAFSLDVANEMKDSDNKTEYRAGQSRSKDEGTEKT